MTNLSQRKRLDPAKTRETILIAALDVFAEKGFDGTSIADIAMAAQVPKSLLQYHFGSKEELWNACLERKALPALGTLDRFLEDDNSASLAALVEARFRVLQANPQIARMLAWISLGTAPMPEFLAKRRAQMMQMGTRHLSEDGLARFLFALASMDGWFLYRGLYHRAMGEKLDLEALSDQFLEFLIGTMLSPDPNAALKVQPKEIIP